MENCLSDMEFKIFNLEENWVKGVYKINWEIFVL